MGKPEGNTDMDTAKATELPWLQISHSFTFVLGAVVIDLEEFLTLLDEVIKKLLNGEEYFT